MSKEAEVIIDDFFKFMRDLEEKTKQEMAKEVTTDGEKRHRSKSDR